MTPEDQEKLLAKCRTWKAFLESDEYQQEWAKIRSDWEAETGRPYPDADLDEWKAMAREAGISADKILEEKWTLSDIDPIIRGLGVKSEMQEVVN